MRLPKNPILTALLAVLWIGGNIATFCWHLQSRPWFGYLVGGAVFLTLGIGVMDYYLNREA